MYLATWGAAHNSSQESRFSASLRVQYRHQWSVPRACGGSSPWTILGRTTKFARPLRFVSSGCTGVNVDFGVFEYLPSPFLSLIKSPQPSTRLDVDNFLSGPEARYEGYSPPGGTVDECVDDMLAGRATAVYYDEPILKYYYLSEGAQKLQKHKLIRDADTDNAATSFLAPAFPFVRPGFALADGGASSHINSNEETVWASALHEQMNMAMLDFVSGEESGRLMKGYFPDNIGPGDAGAGVLPNWYYIVPVSVFSFSACPYRTV